MVRAHVGVGLGGHLGGGGIDLETGHVGRQHRRHAGVGDDQRGAGIGDDRSGPLDRIRRIERQIGGAGLEDAEERDDHVDRSLQVETDQAPGGDTPRLEASRQAVGAAVQLAVRQAAAPGGHGRRVGSPRHLRLELIGNRSRPGDRAGGVVPLDEQTVAFRRVDDRDAAGGDVWRRERRAQEHRALPLQDARRAPGPGRRRRATRTPSRRSTGGSPARRRRRGPRRHRRQW